MAYIVGWTNKEENAAVSSHTVNLPAHVADDLLIVLGSKDGSGTMTCATGGWAQIGTTQSSNGSNVSAVFWKIATSSSETAPTLQTGTADGWVSLSLCIRDADTGTPIDTNPVLSSNAAASQYTQAAVTSTVADCLILYLLGVDGSSSSQLSDPGTHFLDSFDNAGTTYGACAAAAWSFQRTAGASRTCGWTGSISSATNRFTIAIRNKSGGRVPAYVDSTAASPGTKLTPCHHFSSLNGISFPAALDIATIAGKTTVYDVAAATADYGVNPYSAALASTPAATAAGSTAGFQITFGAGKDLSTGLVMGCTNAANPKMANYYLGSIAQGGTIVTFADASNNYRAYQVLCKDSLPNPEGRVVWCVQPSQTETAYGTSGTLDTGAITKMLYTSNNPLATITLYSSEWHQIGTFVVAGGDATTPVDSEGVAVIGASFRLPVIQRTGAAALLAYAPIQIGGGDAVNFQVDAGALQFPRIYSTAKREINYHAQVRKVGISYAGKSGDVIKHTNSVITSPSEYYWEINSGATNAATWDFSGLVVVGAYVTLRNVMTFTAMTFSSCTYLDASGCSLDDCTISKVPATNDSLVLTAASNVDNCYIDVTRVTAGNRLCSVADPSIFTGCTFVGSATAGHAIRITTPGTYALTGNTFSGFGADGTTSAAIFNDSGGAVILNCEGGTSPTVRNGTGASTTVNNSVSLTISAAVSLVGAEIRIYDYESTPPDFGTELAGVESHNAATYVFAGAASNVIWVQIMLAGYEEFGQLVTMPTSNGAFTALLKAETNA